MFRARMVLAATVAVTGLAAVMLGSASAASAAPTLVREYQVTQMTVSVIPVDCPVEGQDDCTSATLSLSVTVPSCIKPSSLQASLVTNEGEAAQITVVGNPPAKCRKWTPTSVQVHMPMSFPMASSLLLGFAG